MANGILQKKQCGRQNKTIKPSGRLNKTIEMIWQTEYYHKNNVVDRKRQ